ncbi:MAG: lysylphosphatidylglycerol synthase transmembrane domain-containing protein [Bradymonadia bacterium]
MRSVFQKYVISIGLGALFIWLAFRNEDWSDFGQRLEGLLTDGRATGLLVLYTVLFLAGHAIRIVRWGVLVRALGPVKWSEIVATGSVGYMCIIVFPFRLGELVRPYLIGGKNGITVSGALATVVVERVIDGLLFVGLFFTFISILPPTGDPKVEVAKVTAYIAGAIFLGALIVLIGGYIARDFTVRVIERIGNMVHKGLTAKVVGLLDAFLEGLKILPDKKRISLFFLYTVLYWAAVGMGMSVMGQATGIPEVGAMEGFALLAVLVVGIMIPAGPGFTGTFEAALAVGFSLLVLSPESAQNITLYTLVLHVIQLVVQVLLGAMFLLTGRVQLKGALGGGAVETAEAEGGVS